MRRWLVLGIVVLLASCTRTVVVTVTAPTPSLPAATTPFFSPSPSFSYSPPPPLYDTPTLSEFTATLKTLSRQCFGNIGCNYTLRVILGERGALNLDPSLTYELTYTVTGDEGGPIIGTIEVTADNYTVTDGEVDVSTDHNSVVPKIKLTALEEQ